MLFVSIQMHYQVCQAKENKEEISSHLTMISDLTIFTMFVIKLSVMSPLKLFSITFMTLDISMQKVIKFYCFYYGF